MDTSNWKQVRTVDGGLSLLLPPGWETEPSDDEEDVLVASPRGGVDPVVVVNRKPATHASASEYKVANVIHVRESGSLPDFADHGGGEWDVAGREISWHSYGYATGGGRRLRVLFYCTLAGDAAYIVTCAAREENFREHQSTLEAIGGRLRATGAAPA